MKRCPSCGKTRPAIDFGRNRSQGDGLSVYCLECKRAKSNKHYRERRRLMGKAVRDHSWVPDGFRWCPSCQQALANERFARSRYTASGLQSWCKACKNAASSEAYFYRTYQLTPAELRKLRTMQGDRCAICADESPQHLDHDHATGRVRRLLCQRCNHGLGLFRDDPRLLHAAAYYVSLHTARQVVSAELTAAAGEGPDGSAVPEARR
jgi:hypothetical protein